MKTKSVAILLLVLFFYSFANAQSSDSSKADSSLNQKTAFLMQYCGLYACPDVPVKVTVSTRDGKLFGQGTGQPEIELQEREKDIYGFEQAGIVMIFHPDKNEFILEQGGGTFIFTREKEE
jgi:hypothetical protein